MRAREGYIYDDDYRRAAHAVAIHMGNGWFGDLLSVTSFAMVGPTGDIYFELW